MRNFKNGAIYKITEVETNETIYVGSTIDFKRRKREHKRNTFIENLRNLKLYTELKRIGWEKVEMEIIENFPCSCRTELIKREQFHLDNLKANANQCRAYTDRREYVKNYYLRNMEKIKAYFKSYYIINGDKKREYERQKYHKNKQKQ
jgi:undecaprenyl pyrophosphate synthase